MEAANSIALQRPPAFHMVCGGGPELIGETIDGSAALMPAKGPEAEKVQNHVTFLENFFDEVRRRIAGAGH